MLILCLIQIVIPSLEDRLIPRPESLPSYPEFHYHLERFIPPVEFRGPSPLFPADYDKPGFDPRHDYFNNRPEEYIDYYNGALHLVYTDLVLPGRGGLDLVIRREYSSKTFRWSSESPTPPSWYYHDSWLGRGWYLHLGKIVVGRWGFSPYLESFSIPGQAEEEFITGPAPCLTRYRTIFTESTEIHYPVLTKSGRYFAYEWGRVFDGETIFGLSVFTPEGIEYFFDYGSAIWDRGLCEIYVRFIRDYNGNTIRVEYYPPPYNSLIQVVTDTYGRKVHFHVDTSNLFLPVLDSITVGARVYRYQVLSDNYKRWLKSFTSPEGERTEYEYGYEAWLLTGVILPTGGKITYEYELQQFFIPYATRGGGNILYYRPLHIHSWVVTGKEEDGNEWRYHYHHPPVDSGNLICEEVAPDSSRVKSYFYTFYHDKNDSIRWFTRPSLIGRLYRKEFYGPAGNLIRYEITFYGDSLGRVNQILLSGSYLDNWFYPYDPDGVFLAVPSGWAIYDSSKAGVRGRAVYLGDATSRYDRYANPIFIQDCGFNQGGVEFPVLRARKDRYAWAGDSILKAWGRVGLKMREEVYDASGSKLKSKVEYDYYPDGRIREDRRYDGQSAIKRGYGYDPSGNPKWFKDENGYLTHYRYSYGVLDRVHDNLGRILTRKIDSVYGLILSQTDANGKKTEFRYDLNGRLTRIIPPLTSPTSITYDLAHRKITVQRGRDYHEHHYDPLGRWVYERRILEDGLYAYNKVDYDWKGRVLREYEARDHPPSGSDPHTEYRYDVLDRVLKRTDPDGETRYEYQGDLVKMTDPSGYITEYRYDGLDRLIEVKDATGALTYYDYDELGNLIRVRMVGVSDREYHYNQLSRLIRQRNPESGEVSFEYDPHGNMVSKTEADGRGYTYQYDERHRLLTVSHQGQELTRYYYDGDSAPGYPGPYINPNNHLTAARDGGIYVYYVEYDDEERLKKKFIRFTDLDTLFEVNYEYDQDGNLVKIAYPSGLEVNQDVHPSGLVRGITIGDTLPILNLVNYNPALGPKRIEYANGVVTQIPPDKRNRPDKIEIGNYLTLDYSYDPRGDIDRIITNGRQDRYHYDELDRLIRVDYGDGKWISYEYDRFGNMLTADGSFPEV
ncbi:MAG TPA: RHS repeat protein, partial [bacterium (Candidatus Stahlbacteria)]|nr:RHS repeat protein [Candidatus Stahlbacteria bacterium]